MKQNFNLAACAIAITVASVTSCTKSPSLVSEDTLEVFIPNGGSVYQGTLNLPSEKTVKSGRFNYEMQKIEYLSCTEDISFVNVEQKPIKVTQIVTAKSKFTIKRNINAKSKLTFKLIYVCTNCLEV